MLLLKNPQFQSNQADIQAKLPTEAVILTKFHNDRAKIVDVLVIVHFCASLIFYATVSISKWK